MLRCRLMGRGRYAVVENGRVIGRICRHDEPAGRSAWRIDVAGEEGESERYRTREAAARALSLAHRLADGGGSRLLLVITAWKRRP